ncbi:cell division protein FtsL [Saccharophagus sp. K07]|nr:cell division protein FtsL [Saccharophagus sp. K07]
MLIFAAWFLVMGSALSVIYVTHRARLATHELETLRHAAADLQAESGQLLLEKSSLSAYARVEQMALKELNMTVPDTDQVVVVKR